MDSEITKLLDGISDYIEKEVERMETESMERIEELFKDIDHA